ncbi:MAG: helicase-related protein, partial [Alistipes sp.]
EQHRFGVEQRARLWSKNPQAAPHVLVMTATPIPRTLAMTLYGDLDVSVIDELPPGRKPVKTVHYRDSHRLRVFGFIRDEIKRGRQVYVVYPLIKESEKMDYKDLEDGYAGIVQAFPPPEYVTVVVHGKMKAADKEYGMDLFKRGVAHIMVATSVIEVGVDVPNASIIVIESERRFAAVGAAWRPRVVLHPIAAVFGRVSQRCMVQNRCFRLAEMDQPRPGT